MFFAGCRECNLRFFLRLLWEIVTHVDGREVCEKYNLFSNAVLIKLVKWLIFNDVIGSQGFDVCVGGRAGVHLHVGHVAPIWVLIVEWVPIELLHRCVIDPDPAAVAADVGVVVPIVQRAACVHNIAHQRERCHITAAAAAVTASNSENGRESDVCRDLGGAQSGENMTA
jgi:hypothetical protein